MRFSLVIIATIFIGVSCNQPHHNEVVWVRHRSGNDRRYHGYSRGFWIGGRYKRRGFRGRGVYKRRYHARNHANFILLRRRKRPYRRPRRWSIVVRSSTLPAPSSTPPASTPIPKPTPCTSHDIGLLASPVEDPINL